MLNSKRIHTTIRIKLTTKNTRTNTQLSQCVASIKDNNSQQTKPNSSNSFLKESNRQRYILSQTYSKPSTTLNRCLKTKLSNAKRSPNPLTKEITSSKSCTMSIRKPYPKKSSKNSLKFSLKPSLKNYKHNRLYTWKNKKITNTNPGTNAFYHRSSELDHQ